MGAGIPKFVDLDHSTTPTFIIDLPINDDISDDQELVEEAIDFTLDLICEQLEFERCAKRFTAQFQHRVESAVVLATKETEASDFWLVGESLENDNVAMSVVSAWTQQRLYEVIHDDADSESDVDNTFNQQMEKIVQTTQYYNNLLHETLKHKLPSLNPHLRKTAFTSAKIV
jgi:hypothetical protein